jgi:hypothetical protein
MYGKPSPNGSGNGWYFISLHELSYMVNVIERFKLKWNSGANARIFETRRKENKPQPIFIEKNPLLPNYVIIDVDNTLTFISNRSPFEWNKVGNDYPNQVVIDHVNIYKKLGYIVIIMSGRDEVCMPETKKWLLDHNVNYDYLYMRKNNDFRKDSIVKKELYEQHIKDKFNVFVSLDDRTQVIDMYRNEKLSVFQVNPSVD